MFNCSGDENTASVGLKHSLLDIAWVLIVCCCVVLPLPLCSPKSLKCLNPAPLFFSGSVVC